MQTGNRHLQLRLPRELRDEIRGLSKRHALSASDIVRGALFYGLPVFSAMADLQIRLSKKLTNSLKKEARKRSN
jgi:hypothetical protein